MIALGRLQDRRPRRGRLVRRRTGTRQSGSLRAVAGILLLLRAFAAGSVALTGTEAIATGVPAFKPPESQNAARTLVVMAAAPRRSLFIGITFLAVHFGIAPVEEPVQQTVVWPRSPAASTATGTIPFFLFQAFTALILFLAANTSLQRLPAPRGDPGPGRLHAAPVLLPRRPPRLQPGHRRAGPSWPPGWWSLFHGETHLLIPLYAVGVFIDFTISPGRHDPALAARAAAGLASAAWRSTPRAAS